MKFTCPRCGRNSEIAEDIGDFPVRCHRCAALLRRKNGPGPGAGRAQGRFRSRWFALRTAAPAPSAGGSGIERGMLADMLGARTASDEEEPTVIHAHCAPAEEETAEPEKERVVLSHETRRVVQRVKARQRRVRRAVLEGSQRALGALGWVGLAVVVLLAIGVLVLQVQAASHH